MNYKKQLEIEINNRKLKIEQEEIELINLQKSIKVNKERLDLIENSQSVSLVTSLLDKSLLKVSLFLDYNKSFRVQTQNEKILKELDELFGMELTREGRNHNRISQTFNY